MNIWIAGKDLMKNHYLIKKLFTNSELYIENFINENYIHAQKVFKGFKLKNTGKYHDLYLRSNVLLLADIFENFRSMCLEIYELDPAKCISAPRLAFQVALKMTKVELDLLTDTDLLLMVEKVIRGGICKAVHRYAKTNNKYMPDCDENKES